MSPEKTALNRHSGEGRNL